MARVEHRRVLLRLYDDVPQHQEILRWLDGYSGRGLQEILRGALLIGLPRLLGSDARQGTGARQGECAPPVQVASPSETVGSSVEQPPLQDANPLQGASSLPGASPRQEASERQRPDFLPGNTNGDAKKVLAKLFESEGL